MKQVMALLVMLGMVTAVSGEWVNVTYEKPWTLGYVNEGAGTGGYAYSSTKPGSGAWTVNYDLRSQMNPLSVWSANVTRFNEWNTTTGNAGVSSNVVFKIKLSDAATSASWDVGSCPINIASGSTLEAKYSTDGVNFTTVYTYPAISDDYFTPGVHTFSFPPTKSLYIGWFASVPEGGVAWYSLWQTGNITFTPAAGTSWEWTDVIYEYPWLPANVNEGANTGGYAYSSTRPGAGAWTVNLNLRSQIVPLNVWSAHQIKFGSWNVVPANDYQESSVIYKINLSENATSAVWDISPHYVDLYPGNTLEARYSIDGINFYTVYSYPNVTADVTPGPQTFSFPSTQVLYLGWFAVSPTGKKAWYNPSETGTITLTPATSGTIPGDVNNDGLVNALDIDEISAAIKAGSTDLKYDLNSDAAVTSADKDYLVRTILHTQYGDATLDKKVDVSDLGVLAANYGTTTGAIWSKGDFTGDGKVDVSDLGVLAANYGFVSGKAAQALDIQQDMKALGLSIEKDDLTAAQEPAPTGSCGSAGFPLIAGMFLAAMLLLNSCKWKG